MVKTQKELKQEYFYVKVYLINTYPHESNLNKSKDPVYNFVQHCLILKHIKNICTSYKNS